MNFIKINRKKSLLGQWQQSFSQLIFFEVDAGHTSWGDEEAYDPARFRPIKDENIEVFRAMDRKIFKRKQVDA